MGRDTFILIFIASCKIHEDGKSVYKENSTTRVDTAAIGLLYSVVY